jgi:hypothetical protein
MTFNSSSTVVVRTSSLLFAFGLVLGMCIPAQAVTVFPDSGSVVQGSAGGDSCPNGNSCFLTLSQTTASGSANAGNSSASAVANFQSGFLSASVSAADSASFNGTQSHALIWDTVTFTGAKSGDLATLTMTGTAIVSPPLLGTGETARANAAALLLPVSASNGVGSFLAGNDSTALLTGDYTITFQAQIQNGVPYLLVVYVDAYTGLSGGPFPGGSASINDPWHLDVPLDVTATFSSASAAPEPSTWAMMILGFCGIGFMAYRRKSKPALMAV